MDPYTSKLGSDAGPPGDASKRSAGSARWFLLPDQDGRGFAVQGETGSEFSDREVSGGSFLAEVVVARMSNVIYTQALVMSLARSMHTM